PLEQLVSVLDGFESTGRYIIAPILFEVPVLQPIGHPRIGLVDYFKKLKQLGLNNENNLRRFVSEVSAHPDLDALFTARRTANNLHVSATGGEVAGETAESIENAGRQAGQTVDDAVPELTPRQRFSLNRFQLLAGGTVTLAKIIGVMMFDINFMPVYANLDEKPSLNNIVIASKALRNDEARPSTVGFVLNTKPYNIFEDLGCSPDAPLCVVLIENPTISGLGMISVLILDESLQEHRAEIFNSLFVAEAPPLSSEMLGGASLSDVQIICGRITSSGFARDDSICGG
ncbi:MAG: hypothetical protein V1834_00180, partial [Candidatus Micrarchaeota archaeon]